MTKDSLQFLSSMMAAPSPSGFEQPLQRVVRDRVEKYADEVRGDLHGNLIAALNPTGSPRVMLAGHCDQVGLMVQHISDDGYLNFATVGGVDPIILAGQRVVVHNKQAGAVLGVIGRKPVHLMSAEERAGAKVTLESLFIDIGAKDKKAAQKLVQVGDCVTYELGMDELDGGLVMGPGFDDKVGVFVAMEALRLLKKRKLSCAVYAVSTVQEELGLRGAQTSAYSIDPLVGIAIDVTHATDYAGVEASRCGEIKMGEGPAIARGPNINPIVGDMLIETAKAGKIPYQVEPCPRGTGTDANAIQISRSGVAAGLVSIPNRYMHTPVEIVSVKDLENAATLIADVVAGIDDSVDFRPV